MLLTVSFLHIILDFSSALIVRVFTSFGSHMTFTYLFLSSIFGVFLSVLISIIREERLYA